MKSVASILLNFDVRFCVYPQEVVLRLTEPANLKKLQILSHQYLVGKFDHTVLEIRSSSCTVNLNLLAFV